MFRCLSTPLLHLATASFPMQPSCDGFLHNVATSHASEGGMKLIEGL